MFTPLAPRSGLDLKGNKAARPTVETLGGPQDGYHPGCKAGAAGNPGGGDLAEGSTVQLRILLAVSCYLLQAVRAVSDVGLAGALPVGWGEAGWQ